MTKSPIEFLAYVGDPDVHDATIESWTHHGNTVIVALKALNGRKLSIRFSDVDRVDEHRAKGMLLYALCEYKCEPPWRWFSFAPWDDEYDGRLHVFARELALSDNTA